ncbi:MAG: DNA translocase FtsK 4TM domain-containing protein, partial [Muribaculaceae bacterium]|nr:DNA translocase FtsK 4TM domain-containing protein [Muribaculaceae bacterium]
ERRSHEHVVPRKQKSEKQSGSQEFDLTAVRNFFKSQTFRWLTGIFLGGFAVYLLVAFVSYFTSCIADQAAIINSPVGSLPPVGNRAGEGGARLAEFLVNGSFGLGSFVVIIWFGMIALKLLSGWPRFKTVNFTIKCLVALITVSLIIGLITIAWDTPVNWGGYHGRYVNEFVVGFFGWTGAVILCLMLVATFFVICLRDFVNWVLRKKNEIAARRREAARLRREQEELERELAEMRLREEIDAVRAGESKADEQEEVNEQEHTVQFSGHDVEIDPAFEGYDLEDEPDEIPVTPDGLRAAQTDDIHDSETVLTDDETERDDVVTNGYTSESIMEAVADDGDVHDGESLGIDGADGSDDHSDDHSGEPTADT